MIELNPYCRSFIFSLRMPFRCCVKSCSHEEGTTMHSFPRDAALFEVWCRAIRREDFLRIDRAKVRRNYRVCDRHFTQETRFPSVRNRTFLKAKSVPSINLYDEDPHESMLATIDVALGDGKSVPIKIKIGSNVKSDELQLQAPELSIDHYTCGVDANIGTAVTSAIVNSMPCADSKHDSLIKATQIFERRCTHFFPEFVVVNVQSDKNPGKVPCRWTVSYRFQDQNRQYELGQYAEQLVKRFDAGKPDGTNLMKPEIRLRRSINNDPCYVVEYGVICKCDNDPYFYETDDKTILHISKTQPQ